MGKVTGDISGWVGMSSSQRGENEDEFDGRWRIFRYLCSIFLLVVLDFHREEHF